jgi:hypothetical protein
MITNNLLLPLVPKLYLGTRRGNSCLFLALLSVGALGLAPAQAVGPDITLPPAAATAPAPAVAPTTTASGASADSGVPVGGYPASRYETLWTKSPFSVATAEDAVQTSPDYLLVGIANVDGIFYASVMERQPPQEHFLVSSDKLTRGLTLKSITKSSDGQDIYASLIKDNQPLTLKLEQPPAGTGVAAPGMANLQPNAPPGVIQQQMQMPGGSSPFPNGGAPTRPYFPRRRPQISLPPQPAPQAQPQSAPPPVSAQGLPSAAPPPPRP